METAWVESETNWMCDVETVINTHTKKVGFGPLVPAA